MFADGTILKQARPNSPVPVPRDTRTEREKILASKSSMAVRKARKRPAPPPDTDDDEEEYANAAAFEVAEDDAHERKLTSVSLWQVFLYHSRRPEKDEENIKAVYGDSVDPHSLEWAEARLRFMNDQKNCKFRVITNMEKLLEKHAQHPEYALLLDTRVSVSRAVLQPMAHAAFSAENWAKVWTYLAGRVSYEKFHPLGKYYIRTMFQGLAVEVAEYLRVKAKNKDLALACRQELLSFYDDMPKKAQYKDLKKDHFKEIFERQRRQKKQKKSTDKTRTNLNRFEILEEPPAADIGEEET